MNRPSSPGACFRAAVREEKPLQVVGAVNAYAARLAGYIRNMQYSLIDIGIAGEHFALQRDLAPDRFRAFLQTASIPE